ncbi:transcriptional regulator, MarR family [Aliivibrio fischeri ES114]|uniref:HTH-type transcriptional regulator SarZ n=2 Tax=Aliivibrio fischeri TaxID=668 RepID=Q5E0P2_ALIF1|nr:transcriptional regulator, MarR family [Aliivibrio fischeri ES114]MUI56031.1 MarR family transcriptional regulator [Aliivibrio fischeri]MUK36672.1 MarR family transcriptional regulator [Aliivibrio fischeri]MUL04716.1 MarR family transcriptional regulator [Aliivibrio fischeri]TGA69064.1 MarR family transcriptional regulator [Aliivibrio fischeri]
MKYKYIVHNLFLFKEASMEKQNKTQDKNNIDSPQLLLKNQVCFSLYSASNAMIRAYRPLLNTLDLTYPQYLAMMVIWEKNGINVKDLGHDLHLDSGTLTPLLKRLESKGIVTRERSKEDERIRLVFLTKQGIELKNKALSVPNGIFCKSQLQLEELQQLKATCEKLLANLEK